ncbi:MAG: hypothetical protein K940chlam6_01237, partial [Chlamydiae bacterium]|nr:hypothetical protein [Chlamydiota bacterium]
MSVRSVNNSNYELNQILKPVFEADKTRNIEKISQAIIDIVKNNNGITLQVVEKSLRENHCFTYLSARRLDSESKKYCDTIYFGGQNHGSKAKFHMFLTTKDKEEAIKELREDSRNPRVNYEKLAKTGCLVDKNTLVFVLHAGCRQGAPQSSCPQPSCPQPSCLQPSCPQPSCLQPSCLQPSCPQPSFWGQEEDWERQLCDRHR